MGSASSLPVSKTDKLETYPASGQADARIPSSTLADTGLVRWRDSEHRCVRNHRAIDCCSVFETVFAIRFGLGSDERGSSTEEHWIAPKGGIMLGVNRGVSRNGKASFEFLRIAETPDGITYFASPGGKEPTPFLLKESTADSVTFENPDHDFPQRVVYRKVDGNLIARIEGSINGKVQSMEWTWKPVAE